MAEKGSDLLYDFCCNVCEEKSVNKEAMYYCQKCSKGYCDECEGLHKLLFTMHVAYERGEIDKWPATIKSLDDLQFCQHHSDHLIEMFCEDHGKLCCSMCLFHEHRPCVKLVLITERSQAVHNPGRFNEIYSTIANVQQELKAAIDDTQECLKKLQESYEKVHNEIKVLRHKINDMLDDLERNTIHSLDTLLQKLKQSFQSDTDKCYGATDDLKKISDALTNIKKVPKGLSFIVYHKSLEMVSQAAHLLKELTVHRSPEVTFKSNQIIYETLSGISSLGNIECIENESEKNKNTILECKKKSLYNIRTVSDKSQCDIRGICELPGGDILIADVINQRVKLLDSQYKVVQSCHMGLFASPQDMFSISPTEIAVAVKYVGQSCTVMFLKVNNRQIVKDRELMIPHHCNGISRFKEHLFIASCTALHQYTLDGQLVKKIYEDTSGTHTVYKCAVSPDGSRLYVTNWSNKKLLTLSMDGTVLSTLQDPALCQPTGLHVSETGQLLVCGFGDNVIQVDGEGGVVTLASKEDGLYRPGSVYYSASTGRLIVGNQNDNILVADTKC